MVSALPLLLFLGLLFGMVLLALTMGILSREEERARAARAAAPALDALEGPRFFLLPEVDVRRPAAQVTETTSLGFVEAHLRRERDVAARFVEQPSFESLYGAAASRIDVSVDTLEAHIRDERRRVASFVAAPSTDGWLGTNGGNGDLVAVPSRKRESQAAAPWGAS